MRNKAEKDSKGTGTGRLGDGLKPPLRVSLFQLTSVDDMALNEERIFFGLRKLAERGGARLVVLPENSLFMRLDRNAKLQAPRLQDPVFLRLTEFCRIHACDILLTTALLEENGQTVNATIRLRSDQSPEVVYRKIHLFDVNVLGVQQTRESDELTAGTEPKIIDIDDWKVGLSICYDLRFSELFLSYAKHQVDILMVPSAFLVPTGRAHWEVLLRARAIESQAYVLAPAQGGSHQNSRGDLRKTWGHTMIVDPWGVVLSQAKNEGEESPQIIESSLDPSLISSVRNQIPMKSHRRL